MWTAKDKVRQTDGRTNRRITKLRITIFECIESNKKSIAKIVFRWQCRAAFTCEFCRRVAFTCEFCRRVAFTCEFCRRVAFTCEFRRPFTCEFYRRIAFTWEIRRPWLVVFTWVMCASVSREWQLQWSPYAGGSQGRPL